MTDPAHCFRCGTPQRDRLSGQWRHERPYREYLGEDWVCDACCQKEREEERARIVTRPEDV